MQQQPKPLHAVLCLDGTSTNPAGPMKSVGAGYYSLTLTAAEISAGHVIIRVPPGASEELSGDGIEVI